MSCDAAAIVCVKAACALVWLGYHPDLNKIDIDGKRHFECSSTGGNGGTDIYEYWHRIRM